MKYFWYDGFMNLLTESLWGDEAFSAMAVKKGLFEMLSVVMKDTAPPLFYLVGWVWGRLFGFSEVALRSLTCLLILGAAIFAGLTVHYLSKNKIASLLTVAVAFFSPFVFRFAFEWRMYALLAFTSMASVYFFTAKKWLWFVVFSLAAAWTHHLGLFTIAGEGVWFMISDFKWRKPKIWFSQLKPFIILGLLYSLWLYPMYIQLTRIKGSGFWLGIPKIGDLTNLVARFTVGGAEGKLKLVVYGLVAIILIGKDWKKAGKQWWGLLFIYFSPVILAFAASYVITPVFYDRYLLSVVVGIAVLVSLQTRKLFLLTLFFLACVYIYSSITIFNNPQKQPFRDLAAYVQTVKQPGDAIVNYNGASHHLWESQYYGIPAPIYTPNGPLPLYVGTAQMTSSDTITLLPKPSGRLGVISSEDPKTMILPGFKMISIKKFRELSFSWWIMNKK